MDTVPRTSLVPELGSETNYTQINKALLAFLHQSTHQEKQEREGLHYQWRVLKHRIVQEQQRSKKIISPARKKELSQRIKSHSQELRRLKNELQHFHLLHSKAIRALNSLRKQEHSNQKQWQVATLQLEKKISEYILLKKQEAARLQKSTASLNAKIIDLQHQKKNIAEQAQKAVEILAGTKPADAGTKAVFGIELAAGMKERQQHQRELAETTHLLTEEQKQVHRSLSSINAEIQKLYSQKDRRRKELIAARQELQELVLLKKKKVLTEKALREQKQRMQFLQSGFNRITAQKKNYEHRAKRELATIQFYQSKAEWESKRFQEWASQARSMYTGQQSHNLQLKNKLQRRVTELKKRKEAEEQKINALQEKERELQTLLQDAQKQTAFREASFAAKIKEITHNLGELQTNRTKEQERLQKVKALLQNIREIGVEDRSIIERMNEERKNIVHHLLTQARSIHHGRQKLQEMQKELPSLHQQFLVKKNDLVKDLKERQKAILRCKEVMTHTTKILTTLTHKQDQVQRKGTSIQEEQKREQELYENKLARILREIHRIIPQKQQQYRQDLEHREMLHSRLLQVRRESRRAQQVFQQHARSIGRISQLINHEEQRQKLLASEEQELNKIMNEIGEKKNQREKIRDQNYQERVLIEKRRQKLALTLREHLQKIQGCINQKAAALVEYIDTGITKYEHEKKRELLRLQMEDAAIARKIVKYEALFKKEKQNSTLQLASLRRKESHHKMKLQSYAPLQKSIQEKLAVTGQKLKVYLLEKAKQEAAAQGMKQNLQELEKIAHLKQQKDLEILQLHQELRQIRRIITAIPAGKIKNKIHHKVNGSQPVSVSQMKSFLKSIDLLLGDLPAPKIAKFAKSPQFNQYKDVLRQYHVK